MEIQEIPQGTILSIKVKPNSSRFGFLVSGDDAVLELRSPPKEDRANQEILRELPKLLRCDVQILRGSHSKRKLILLKGISQKELRIVLDTR
jgi:uncharacterized protein (TIGR00251 family)